MEVVHRQLPWLDGTDRRTLLYLLAIRSTELSEEFQMRLFTLLEPMLRRRQRSLLLDDITALAPSSTASAARRCDPMSPAPSAMSVASGELLPHLAHVLVEQRLKARTVTARTEGEKEGKGGRDRGRGARGRAAWAGCRRGGRDLVADSRREHQRVQIDESDK